ncbi:hypothetical protein LZK98_09145 [Sphingomonas cannabina]|nr:hypothetical protein [Sphingomonas cannabina]UIJ47088.1 hypothetical protein LZK98_09145 [Sphingomonas cannabina]
MAETGQAAPSYAAIADRLTASPIVIDAVVRDAIRLKDAAAANTEAGRIRYYVQADVQSLIRAPSAIPTRISYLADVPTDSRGKPPKLKKLRVLLFARPVPNRPGEIQLTDPDAQQPWTPALDALVRRIVKDLVAPDAPPVITGVGNAFHVPGTLPGEGETQIFLLTPNGRPVSLNVLRRPGEQPRWAVALSEIVDEAAGPPAKDTLLWYRLACGLPPTLPDRALASMEEADAAAAREDYDFVLKALGPCGR